MEALGGDQLWFDRFVAEHSALSYYWVLILMYLFSPKDAYAFSELVEWHAAGGRKGTHVFRQCPVAGKSPSVIPSVLKC